MAKCTFCGNNIEKGTGKIYVKKDAKILYFCSSKCEKNHIKLGRKGQKQDIKKECQRPDSNWRYFNASGNRI